MTFAARVWLPLLGVLLANNVARATGQTPIAIAIDYQAPPECPPNAVVAQEVLRRSPRIVITEASQTENVFFVTVKHLDDGYMGNLRAGPAEDSVRHVRDDACEAVVSALALMVVLAVDPRTGEGVNHKAAEDGSQRRVTAPAQTSPPTVPKRPLSQWRLSATGVGRTDLWRSLAMGAGLSLWWARSHTEQKWQWSPAVGVMVAHAPRTELPLQADAGRARFDWTAGALSACAAAFNRPPFMLRGPCLGLNVGAIRGQGLDLAQPRDATRLWLSVEATVQMSVHPGGPFFIRVVGGAAMPLLRHQFVFRSPDVLLYQTPGLGAVAMVDVGVIF